MTLRRKSIALISGTVVTLIAILFLITQIIIALGFDKVQRDLHEGFSRIELQNTRRDVQRVKDALSARINNLAVKAADWAMWDDTYRFIVDRNSAYRESNLPPDALSALKINLMVLVNDKGEQVFSMAYDLQSERQCELPADLFELLTPSSPLLRFYRPDDCRSGIVMLGQNPLMFVSRPIVKSNGTGPSRGAVIFGRFLDEAEIEDLSAVTHLSIRTDRIEAAATLDEDFRLALQSITADTPIVIRALSSDTIAGYGVVNALGGKPGLMLRVAVDRDIHRQGLATSRAIHERGNLTMLSLVISIVMAGLVLGGVILLLMESAVLSRLARLSDQASAIGASGDFSTRVSATGTDEIARLASSLNSMLAALATSHEQIAVRNSEMSLLMDTVPAGLLSMDETLRINPQYSSAAERIFGQSSLAGRHFGDLLGLDERRTADRSRLVEFLEIFRQESLPEKELRGLNPFDQLLFERQGEKRWLRLQYFLLRRPQGLANHILAIVTDITEEKALSEQATRSQQENVQLKAIAENPDLFREFLLETRQILQGLEETAAGMSPGERGGEGIQGLFRGVHTIKGVARSFGLFRVADLAGGLEERLAPLREIGQLSVADILGLQQGIADLAEAFREVVESTRRFLGDDLEGDGGIALRIPLKELKQRIAAIESLDMAEYLKSHMLSTLKTELVGQLRSLQAIPASRGLARSLKILPGLIERLGKQVEFVFEGRETLIDCETATMLNTPLIHMLRNAIDHGIESPEQRQTGGKPARGVLRLAVSRQDGKLLLELRDDGRGLDPEAIKDVALRKGIVTLHVAQMMTAQQCFELLFHPGFSMAETVSDVSGRGMGMSAAQHVVRSKLRGEILIQSEVGKGTVFSIVVPAVGGQVAQG